MQIKNAPKQTLTTRDLTLSSGLAAVFIVSTFFPLTAFIGGAAFITLEIVVVPLIAAFLRPVPATIAIFAGALGMAAFQNGLYPVFGFFGLLVPAIAAILGSMSFHYRWGPLLPWAYVLGGSAYYILFSRGGTLLWLAPYILVIISLPVMLRASGKTGIALLALYTAMTEQVTMNVLSIGLLGLVDGVWTLITPFMFVERTVAVISSTVLIVALKSRLGGTIPLGLRLTGGGEVKVCVSHQL